MRKTYVTKVPDQVGVFLKASRIISAYGGNIVRMNYNRAVDMHTVFIEVAAEPEQHREIAAKLAESGFLSSSYDDSRIMMLALRVPNQSGSITPALEVLNSHHINISYVSAAEDGTPYQTLKLGILMENTRVIKDVLDELSKICEVRILNYEVTDRHLDSTVFYVTFANEMRDILHLSPEDANCVLIRANKMMQVLDEQDKSPLQTFNYIRRFAKFVADHRGDHFDAAVSSRQLADGLTMHIIEPPCGSNTFVLDDGEELLLVDGGYSCFREEQLHLLREHIPAFDSRKKTVVITHVDMDHTGLMPAADRVYMSRESYENFLMENRGEGGYREQNLKHRPYFALSEIITEYKTPPLDAVEIVGEKNDEELLTFIGSRYFRKWKLDFYEGPGGHVKGETVIVCEELKVLFSGDIYVNVKGITPEQREFNRLAPFLLTGVDEDPALGKKTREYLLGRFSGYLYCSGHGQVQEIG